jgi:CopG family transcriptional regulator / antitoxin EndoAI
MYQQINITLPQKTIELIDRLAAHEDLNQLVDDAINLYITDRQKKALQQQLREGAICRGDRDLGLVEDWFSLEEEAWHKDLK